jgi:DNA-binding MarR family transcriptional regulator
MSPSASPDYQTLAEFRYQIRAFLHFSEAAARAYGLDAQQHQMLLALKGLPNGITPTVGAVAERLQVRHHSAVELLDRLASKGCIARTKDPDDARRVRLTITRHGEALLHKLTAIHQAELHTAGPHLLDTLRKLLP